MFGNWVGRSKPARARRVAPHAEWLEPRLLYSADAGSLLLATTDAAIADTRTLTATSEYATATTSATPSADQVRTAYALAKLQFEANAGQLGDGVDFAANGVGYGVRLGGGQAELLLAGAQDPVRLELVGANAGTAIGENPQDTRSNYLVGQDPAKWKTDIANYGSVRYQGVYDGIDVRYYGNQDQLEYDFLLAAGADASRLQLRFHGTDNVSIAANGDLVLQVAGTDRELRFQAPVSYQQGADGREAVESHYELQADGTVRIVVGAYDTTRALVVDPVLSHASYFGEAGAETALGVAVGADGAVYVTGQTTSTTGTFGTRLATGSDGNEVYVAKFSADLSSLVYATRVGGSNNEEGNAIAVDASGNAIVTGWTKSTDFVGTATGDQATRNGTQDAFLFKLNAAGNGLVFSTYIGGSGNTDTGTAVAVDGSGNVYAAGTVSGTSDDAFAYKYSAAGTSLSKWTYGGTGVDGAAGLAVDAAGNVYVAGNTLSNDLTIVNGAQTARPGVNDGFLVKYDASGTVAYSTYIGWTKDDTVTGLAADDSGKAYVIGRTKDPTQGFPVTSGAFETTRYTNETGFLRIYDTTLAGSTSMTYSTFIGDGHKADGATSGTLTDNPTGIALDGGYVAIVGHTDSADLPTTADAIQATNTSGQQTGFVLVLKPVGSGAGDLIYGTYYGTGLTLGAAAWGTNNRLYVVGSTPTSGLATSDGFRNAYTGGGDGLVAQFGGFPNRAPVLSGANDLPAQAEDAAAGSGTLVSDLIAGKASDEDAGALRGIAITAADSANGSWQYTLDGSTWTTFATPAAGSALLLAADGTTRVRFVANADYNGASSISFNAWDRTSGTAGTVVVVAGTGGSTAFSSATATAGVTVTPVNDAPVLTGANNLPDQAEDAAAGSGVLVSALLAGKVSDVDAGALSGVAITAAAGGGTWQYTLDGSTWTTFTTPAAGSALLLASDATTRVRFLPDANFNGTSSITFAAWDRSTASAGTVVVLGTTGGTSAFSSATATAAVTVTPVNDAPVLAGANDLPSVLEDSAAGTGALVASLLTGQVSDADTGAVTGVAITAASGGGTWQYALNGTSWVTFTAPAAGNALLLAADATTRVRFVPAADFAGDGTLSFAAWDRTSGTAGTVVPLGTTGGASAFSSNVVSASAPVTAINDAPVVIGTPTTTLTFTESATPVSLSGANFNFGPGGGSDEAAQAITIVITRLPVNAGTLMLADGTPVVLNGTYTLADLQAMQIQLRAPGDALMFDVKDSGGTANGGVDTLANQTLAIAVTNVAPVLNGSNAFTQTEDIPGNGTLVSDLIAGTVSDPGGAYGIAVTSVPNSGTINGVWQYSVDGGSTWLTLSGSNNNARLLGPTSRVRFLSDAGENINGNIPGFTFRAWDGSSGAVNDTVSTNGSGGNSAFSTATATVSLYVTPVNDAPIRYSITANSYLPAPANVTVNEGSAATSLGLGYLEYIGEPSVAEYNLQTLTYTVTGVPSGAGTIVLSDGVTVVNAGTSYTLAQLQGMKFIAGTGVQNASGTFSWNVTDDGGTANGGVDTLAEAITITVRNVAPTLSGTNNLTPILEDTPGTGTKVADLVSGKEIDPAGSYGIAVTAVNTASGTWQYSRDGGSTWSAITGVSSTNALLLSADTLTRVRFVPNANFNGTVTGLTFRAWDRSTGTAGGMADPSVNGGATAFSTATATASITVGGVNDAPVRTAGSLDPLIVLDGSPATSLGLGAIAYGPGGGTDEAGQTLSYTVTGLPSSLGTIVLANGTTVVTAGTSYTLAQIQGMQFKSSGIGALGSATFTFAVKDNGGTANGGVDTLAQSVAIIVNRAPVLAGANSTLTVYEDFNWSGGVPQGNPPPWASGSQRAGALVADLVSGQIVDTSGSLSGIAINATTGTGAWQYSLDNGTSWVDMPAVGATNSLLLAADGVTRVRFLPGTDFNTSIGPAGITFRAWDQTTGTSGATADTSWNGGASAYSAVTATSNVVVNPVNDAPVRTAGMLTAVSALEGGASLSLGLGSIAYAPGPATATDEATQALTYKVTGLPASLGTITLADGTTVVTANTVYTLAQIQGMRFLPTAGTMPGTGTFSFQVQDNGGVANGGADTLAQSLTITVVNQPPVLAGANAMTGILEDTPGNGTLVADLVAGQITDVTSARGIAVTAADTSHGSWEYTTDGGTTWLALGLPTASTARLLAADTLTRVRFVPAADWNGTATLTFAAWDRSAGTAGATGDATAGGSSSAFSAATATSSIVVVPVNDAPVLASAPVANLTVAEDAASTSLGLSGVTYGPGGGTDEAAQNLAYTVTALPPAALGTITLADGTAVTAGPYTLAQLQGMCFVAAANANGSGSFSFSVQDDGGVANGGVDTLVQTIAITVTPVNDVPVRTAGTVADLTVAEDSGTTSLGLGAIAYGPGGGVDEAGQALSYTVTTLPPAALGRILLADGTAVAAGTYTLADLRGMRFEAAADANGSGAFAFAVTDDGGVAAGGSDTLVQTLAITVTAVNDAPVRTAGSVSDLTVAEDSGSTSLALGTVAYAPGGGPDEAGQVLTYTVTALPPASLGTITLADGTAVTTGSYTLAQLQGMCFATAADGNGSGTFAFTVSDDGVCSTDTLLQTVQITVTPVDDPTLAVADTATALEDSVASGNVLANDSDVDSPLQVASFAIGGTSYAAGSTVAVAGIGSFTLGADGGFRFTPLANWNGSVPQVAYTTTTGALSTLDIAITAQDDPTVVVDDSNRVPEDSAATGNVLANDSDVDDVLAVASFQVAGDATLYAAGATATLGGIGTVTLAADGSYAFTPVANWNGAVPLVSYTTNTGATGALAIDITPVDTVTTTVADSATAPEDGVASGNVLANDTDADDVLAVASFQVAGDAAVYAAGTTATIAGQGTLAIGADGSFTFTPLANWNGSVPAVTYTTNTAATGSLSITITAVDDPTQAVADSGSALEDHVASGNVLANDSDVDDVLAVASFRIAGDSTTYAAGATATVAGQGTFTLAADGSYAFTPLANWNGSVALVSYTTDTGATATLAIGVTAVDDPSVLVADAQTVLEDSVASGNVLANDTDVDDVLQVATFTLAGTSYAAGATATLAGTGSFTLAADGTYAFTPVADWNGSMPVVGYTTSTGASSTLAIDVTAVDDPTVVVADAATALEDSAATGNVLANDSDVDSPFAVATFQVAGDGTTYAAGATATLAGQGTLTIAADGSFTFTPLANWNGSVPAVSYTTDTGVSGTLAITITPQDDPSQLVADAATAAEDSTASGNVLANDSDVDDVLAVATFQVAGDGSTYAAGSSAAIGGQGTLTIAADGSFTFVPLADWNGSVPVVTYTTNTGVAATLAVTISAVDDPATAVADNVTAAEDSAATGNVLANDSDVDSPLSVASFQVAGSATTYAAGATAVVAGAGSLTLVADGSFTFTPVADWNGSVPLVSYTTGTGATATLAITIAPVDDASVLAADALTVDEDTVATGNVLANDADIDSTLLVDHFQLAGDANVYAAGVTATIAGVGSMRVDADGGFVFTPVADWNGAVPLVSYTTDTGATSTLAVTLTPVDDPSVVVADSAVVAEDSDAIGNVLANDRDVDNALAVTGFHVSGDATAYAAGATATIAGVGTVTVGADGAFTFAPVADWNGSVPDVSYDLNTGVSGTLAITVTAVDDPTVAAADAVTVAEDSIATGNVLANDSDVDSVVSLASFQVNGDATVYAAGDTATMAGTGTIVLRADGSFTFTPAADWNGSVPVVSYTTDTGATSTLSVTVTPVDDPTVAAADAVSVPEDSITNGNVLANDTDVDSTIAVASFQVAGDGTTYAAGASASIAGVGSVTIAADGSFTFTPVANWNGSAPLVSYTTDTGVGSTLAITVTPTADPTVLASDSVTADEDTVATGNVLANDSDPDGPLAVTAFQVAGDATTYAAGDAATIAGAGTFTLAADGSFTFTPLPDWNGAVPLVSYTVDTGAGSTLAITIAAVAEPTVTTPDTATVAEDSIATGNVLANDSDADGPFSVASFQVAGDANTYLAGANVAIAGTGTVTLGADGSFVFTPLANWNGTVPVVSYTTDTGATSTLTITVTPVADPTLVTDDTATIAEDGVATGNVLANDSDVDGPLAVASFQVAGDAATYAAGATATLAGQGTLSVAADGSYTFTPLANWNGSVPLVSYTTDTGATGTLGLTVTPVDDPTVAAADEATANEDTVASGNVLANDSDIDSALQVATFTLAGNSYAAGATVALAGVGSFTLAADGSYTFTAVANWNGAVPQVGYTTNTGASSTLDITVAAVDDPSALTADAVTVAEDTTASGNVLANDSDIDSALQVASFTLAGNSYAAGATVALAGVGSFTLAADGSYTFAPVANWNGTVPQVGYTTNTGASSTLDITVAPVDDPTLAAADVATVNEDTAASGNVLANDTDIDSALQVATFTLAGNSYAAGTTVTVAGAGSFTLAADGSYTFTPVANWNGNVPQVGYTTNTGASSTLDISIAPVDDPSSLAPDAVTVAEDTAASGNVLANDSDIDSVLQVATFTLAGNSYAAGATVALAGVGSFTLAADGSYTFAPVANWNGAVPQVGYTTSTGASSTLDLTVTAVDDASSVAPDAVSANEDTLATGNVLANDTDVDDTLQVATFSVGGSTYAAGTTVTLTGAGSFTLAADGSYTFTPVANWNGAVPQVGYTTNTGASSTLDITIAPVDDPSTVVADAVTIAEDTTASGNVLGNDSDVDSALQVTTFSIGASTYAAGTTVTVAGAGSFTLAADGSYSFTPVANWNGSVPQVGYTTNTGASSTLDITVAPVDDASALAADAVSVAEDTMASGNVLANDSDVDSVLQVATFTLGGSTHAAGTTVTVAGAGSFTLAVDGSYTFTPVANWNGALPQVGYTTNTGASSTLDITIAAVDDPTAVAPDAVTVAEDTTASGNVLANDADVDSALQVATFTLAGNSYAAGTTVALASVGSFTLAADGSYTFTPVANWNGALPQIGYTTNTGASSTLAITVAPVDDPAVLAADVAGAVEDTPASGNVLANDSDIDSPLQVTGFQVNGTSYAAGSVALLGSIGSFRLAADGSWLFLPVADWNGAVPQVTYTTTGGTTSTLDIVVAAVDDAPVLLSAPPADISVVEGSNGVPLGLGGLAYAPGGGIDEAAQNIVVTVSAVPDALGTVLLADQRTAVRAGSSYTLQQLQGMVFTAGPGVSSGSGTFAFAVSDDAGNPASLPASFTVSVVNRAPTLDGANALRAIDEDSVDAGMLVSDVIAGHAADPGGRLGIAVVAADNAAGRWEFSRDGGASWSAFTGVSTTSAELLPADASARVRFVPAADWNGQAGGLLFRAWDQADGTAGTTRADTTANGGSSAFSSTVAGTTITVAAVNDAPQATSSAPAVVTATEGSTGSLQLSGVAYAPGGGADEAGQALTFTITQVPSSGTIVRADGTPVVAGDTLTAAAFQDLQYAAATGSSGSTGQFAWVVHDNGGTSNGGVDQTPGALVIQVQAAVAQDGTPAPDVVAPSASAPPPAPVTVAPQPVAAPPALATPPLAANPGRVAGSGGDVLATPSDAGLLPAISGFAPDHLVAAADFVRVGELLSVEQRTLQLASLAIAGGGDFLVTGFAGLDARGARITVDQFQQALRSGAFIDELNRLRRQLHDDFDLDRSTSVTVAGLSLGASVVYILWLIRGGVLVGSYLSALPAWRLLDPLPVLARGNEEGDEDDDEAFDGMLPDAPDPLRGFA